MFTEGELQAGQTVLKREEPEVDSAIMTAQEAVQTISPVAVIRLLDRLMPADRTIWVSDSVTWTETNLKSKGPRSHIEAVNQASIGYTPAAAIGYLFIQLMHVGRMSHPDNTPHHRQPVGPSAIAPGVPMFTVKLNSLSGKTTTGKMVNLNNAVATQVSMPTVVLGSNVASSPSSYSISYNTGAYGKLNTNDTITVQFPAGTVLPAAEWYFPQARLNRLRQRIYVLTKLGKRYMFLSCVADFYGIMFLSLMRASCMSLDISAACSTIWQRDKQKEKIPFYGIKQRVYIGT